MKFILNDSAMYLYLYTFNKFDNKHSEQRRMGNQF